MRRDREAVGSRRRQEFIVNPHRGARSSAIEFIREGILCLGVELSMAEQCTRQGGDPVEGCGGVPLNCREPMTVVSSERIRCADGHLGAWIQAHGSYWIYFLFKEVLKDAVKIKRFQIELRWASNGDKVASANLVGEKVTRSNGKVLVGA